MKRIVQQIERRVHQMNLDVEATETVCQWRNIAMELNIAPMVVMKTCVDSRQIRV